MADNEHQVIADVRLHRGYDETISHDELYKREALHLSLLTQEKRAIAIRDFDNKVNSYDEAGSSLRQKAQAHRFGSYLRGADLKLRAAGR